MEIRLVGAWIQAPGMTVVNHPIPLVMGSLPTQAQ